ncbi:MAG TPA: cupredoxin domain-containing protein [Pseudonocardiaceae bacterium]|jgi:plastocyanin|nr:cupredoxin domain-containing protein [Pseudonocardiaceae bacterium]
MMTPPTAAIRLRPTAIVLTMLVAVLGLVLGCGGGAGSPAGGGGGPATAPSSPSTIVMKNFTFMPTPLTVAPGTKITVINQDQAPHTVTADDKSFDSGTISGGQRGEFTAPTKPGSYPYICTIHQYMKGTLIVQ